MQARRYAPSDPTKLGTLPVGERLTAEVRSPVTIPAEQREAEHSCKGTRNSYLNVTEANFNWYEVEYKEKQDISRRSDNRWARRLAF